MNHSDLGNLVSGAERLQVRELPVLHKEAAKGKSAGMRRQNWRQLCTLLAAEDVMVPASCMVDRNHDSGCLKARSMPMNKIQAFQPALTGDRLSNILLLSCVRPVAAFRLTRSLAAILF